jgi:uncharacterized protein
MKPQTPSIKPLKFDWDEGNKTKNYQKHQITYKECEEVFFNKPLINNLDEKHSQYEKRFRSLGRTNKNRKLFISYTIRNQKIRIISARDQNKKERRIYEKV